MWPVVYLTGPPFCEYFYKKQVDNHCDSKNSYNIHPDVDAIFRKMIQMALPPTTKTKVVPARSQSPASPQHNAMMPIRWNPHRRSPDSGSRNRSPSDRGSSSHPSINTGCKNQEEERQAHKIPYYPPPPALLLDAAKSTVGSGIRGPVLRFPSQKQRKAR